MIEVKKLEVCPEINPLEKVCYTEMGNVVEIQYMSRKNTKATVRMLGDGEYLEVASGEIKKIVNHSSNRNELKCNLYKTFKKLRGIINANVVNVNQVRWCTLTYGDNVRSPDKLYKDFDKFNKRLKYYCNKNGFGKYEYISIVEPQARGSWHIHLLLIFKELAIAPYIPHEDFWKLWSPEGIKNKRDFVKIKKLDNVDNVGAYLTAYLGDIPVEIDDNTKAINIGFNFEELQEFMYLNEGCRLNIKTVEVEEEEKKVEKKFLKGARLCLYPTNFNIYRTSRGIKRPKKEEMFNFQAQKKVSAATLTYEKTLELNDSESTFNSLINYKYYNRVRN